MRDERVIRVNYWVRFGDPNQTAIVILPGLDEQALAWRKVVTQYCYCSSSQKMAELANRTIVVINQRGQGPTRDYELEQYGFAPQEIPRVDQITILHTILEHLELQNVVLVGHSYGGGTILGSLRQDELRARVRSVILLAPHVGHFERFTTDYATGLRMRAAAWLELVNPFFYKATTAAYLPLFFDQMKREGKLCPYTREWTSERMAFLSAMTLGVLSVNTRDDLSVLEDDPRPVHLMIAEHDRLVPIGAHQYLYDLLPEQSKGQLLKPTGSTHRLHQNAQETIALLLASVADDCDMVILNESLLTAGIGRRARKIRPSARI
jgi:pimeloyl-ACP methyl ester carboxylesterase